MDRLARQREGITTRNEQGQPMRALYKRRQYIVERPKERPRYRRGLDQPRGPAA
jgi:hypothetical protein